MLRIPPFLIAIDEAFSEKRSLVRFTQHPFYGLSFVV